MESGSAHDACWSTSGQSDAATDINLASDDISDKSRPELSEERDLLLARSIDGRYGISLLIRSSHTIDVVPRLGEPASGSHQTLRSRGA